MIDQAKHDALYTADMYALEAPCRKRHADLGDAIGRQLEPKCSVLDLGCGAGIILGRLYTLGFDVLGIDASTAAVEAVPVPYVMQADITTILPDKMKVCDAVVCTETAEHIEEYYADKLVDLVCQVAQTRIVWSAAHPGQRGTDHVNCQPAEYWLEKFRRRGWETDIARTDALRKEMVYRFTAHCEYCENFFVFRRKW